MWPYPWTHVGTPSHLGHMDRLAATMPSQAHAGAAQEAPDIGQWEGQDVPLVRPSSCNVKGGIPSSRRYLPTYLPRFGCPSGGPRVSFSCVCARALAVSAPPPAGWCGARISRGPGTGRWKGRSTWSVPLRVSCPGPVLRLACLGGGGPVPVPPYLAWGCGNGGPWPPVLWSGQPGFRVPRVPGAVGAGVGSQHRPHSVRRCGPALLAVGVAEGRPWGGAFHRCEGRLVSGAVPPSAARPLERAARVPRPVCPGCGRCGRGDPSPAPQREPLRAGVARCGGGGKAAPGGGCFPPL